MEEENIKESKNILDKLLRNEHVSRWDVFRLRKIIKRMMNENEEYEPIRQEVIFLIDSAEESL